MEHWIITNVDLDFFILFYFIFVGTQVPCKVLDFMEHEYFTWNSSSRFFFFFFKFLVHYNLIVQKSNSKLKLDFQKIEFQNKSISLNSFKYEVFCWKVFAKGTNAHFLSKDRVMILLYSLFHIYFSCFNVDITFLPF